MSVRPNRRVTACAVAVLTASTSAVALISTAAPASAAKAKSAPVWTQISSGSGIHISYQPRVVRWGSKLIVVWARDTSTTTEAVFSRLLNGNGKPIGGISSVTGTWSTVSSDPTVLLLGGVPTVAMGGLHSEVSTDPLNGPMVHFKAGDATSWALQPGSLTQTRSAYGDYGFGVVDDGTGQPISAGAYSSSDHVTVHHGVDPSVPAAAADQQVLGTGGDIDDVNVARDSKTGIAYAVWYSLTGPEAQQGIHEAEIFPGIGAPSAPAPKSLVNFEGSLSSVDPGQDVAVASRVGGGVWAAYTSGYPGPRTIVMWNLTTGRTLAIHTSGEAQYVSLSAAPGGRLWLSWVQSGKVYATRTNPAVTKFGVVRGVTAPGGYSPTRLAGDGTLGPLDAVITDAKLTPTAQIYTAHVYEGLRVAVSPAKVSYAKGGRVTVTVTDAGVPVPGVSVKIGSKVVKTNSAGKAAIVVARHTGKGKHVVSVTGAGWYPGAGRFTVH